MASAAKGGKAADLGGGGDSKMQLMLRALQSQELKQVEMSAEELSEAERR